LALSELLLEEGWRVVGISRRSSTLQATDYEHHVADVRSGEFPAVLEQVVERHAVDVCVYCAGTGEFLDKGALQKQRTVFDVNLLGAVSTTQIVLPAMVRAGGGQFIGLSSQADGLASPDAPSYSASKAALSSYLEGLAPSFRRDGVFISNLRFGFVDTKMAKAAARPFMVSARVAAEQVRRCMHRRPVRMTYPKRLLPVLWLVALSTAVRRWAS